MKEELREHIKSLPKSPGVYLMKNHKDKVIYVGKAKNLRARVRSYFYDANDLSLKTKFLVNQISQIDFQLTGTEVEAFLLEATLIKKFRPRYNIRLKDDKAYPYIQCTVSDLYPRFYLARKVKIDGSLYFGPYTSGLAVRETIRFLNQTFKVRDCRDHFMKSRTRACMTHQIGRCEAPCVGFISAPDYQKDVGRAVEFLRGESSRVLLELERRMARAAEQEFFEQAARLRDSIQSLARVLEKQKLVGVDQEYDQDVVAFVGDSRGTLVETLSVRRGRVIGSRPHFLPRFDFNSPQAEVLEWLTSFLNQYYQEQFVPDEILIQVDLGADMIKLLRAVIRERSKKDPEIRMAMDEQSSKLLELAKANAQLHFDEAVTGEERLLQALEEIKSKFNLPSIPLRMECFDISNFQGSENVASQVVFEEGVAKKEDYRRYKIKSFTGANDYASMKEVLSRRLRHSEQDDPQLIVLDGGKGQLTQAIAVLKELGRQDIPVVAMAKTRVRSAFKAKEIESTQERFFLPGRQNPITFSRQALALQVLVSIRDEAHRFAIGYHRKLRDSRTLESQLDGISGLGPKKKQVLLSHFTNIDEIRSADWQTLSQLTGFNESLANKIIESLKNDVSQEDPIGDEQKGC